MEQERQICSIYQVGDYNTIAPDIELIDILFEKGAGMPYNKHYDGPAEGQPIKSYQKIKQLLEYSKNPHFILSDVLPMY